MTTTTIQSRCIVFRVDMGGILYNTTATSLQDAQSRMWWRVSEGNVGLIARETYPHLLTNYVVEKVKREMSPTAARSPTEDLQYQPLHFLTPLPLTRHDGCTIIHAFPTAEYTCILYIPCSSTSHIRSFSSCRGNGDDDDYCTTPLDDATNQ